MIVTFAQNLYTNTCIDIDQKNEQFRIQSERLDFMLSCLYCFFSFLANRPGVQAGFLQFGRLRRFFQKSECAKIYQLYVL